MSRGGVALDEREAARRIREALAAGCGVTLTAHAWEELAADKLTVVDIRQALKTCRVVRRERDVRFGNWKYTVEGTSDERRIGVVVVIETDPDGLLVITVWEVKGRWH
jgi:hypothetical protein